MLVFFTYTVYIPHIDPVGLSNEKLHCLSILLAVRNPVVRIYSNQFSEWITDCNINIFIVLH
jgi:hypothetical protein